MDLALFSITLNTHQLDSMKSFYQALGCQFQTCQVDKGSAVHKTKIGTLDFSLYSVGTTHSGSRPPVMQLSLKVRDLDQIISRIRDLRGVTVILDPSEMPEGRRSIVLDPDGNSIDLTEEAP